MNPESDDIAVCEMLIGTDEDAVFACAVRVKKLEGELINIACAVGCCGVITSEGDEASFGVICMV